MDVVVVASQKGGAGKTTLTGHLAVAATQGRQDHPVVIIDTDPQGSLSSWWNRRRADTPAISVLPNLQALPERVEELRRSGIALVIIDTPPAITNAIRGAMRVADLVVMPVRPSPHDLDAIGATIDLARQEKVEFVVFRCC